MFSNRDILKLMKDDPLGVVLKCTCNAARYCTSRKDREQFIQLHEGCAKNASES